MARRKKNKGLQQVVTIGALLIVLQVAYIFFWPHAKPVSIQDSINDAVSKQSDVKRREQMRIQLSVSDFRSRNGKLPAKLDELVPLYFSQIPKDPSTGQAFQYAVKDGRPLVGDPSAVQPAKGGTDQGKHFGVVPASVEEIAKLPPAVQKALIDSLAKDAPQQPPFVYDPTNQRDPFQPFDFAPKAEPEDESKSPLERLDVNQFKLTAVLNDLNGIPTALVENSLGKGFSIKKGAKIGIRGGEVVDIRPDRIVIVETTTDFTGKSKSKTIELRLRTKEQEDKLKTQN